MKIALRCENCGNIFMQEEDDICFEIDFKDKQIRFVCRNKKCNYENIFDFGGWLKKQKSSPLPSPIISKF